METFRDETTETGDVTTWVYDEATGAVVAKTYADGRGVTYTLTNLGQVATRTDARGIVTTYTYNLYGDVTAIAYSDGTLGVTFTYDSYGRQASVTGAVTASGTRALDNPFRFSSEFADDTLGLVYYNYRPKALSCAWRDRNRQV